MWNRVRIALALLLALSPAAEARAQTGAQTGAQLLEQGLRKEQVDGDVRGAIAIYQNILARHTTDRALAAKALVRLGAAYEKLGQSEARTAYQRIIRDYADQTPQADVARARLAALDNRVAAQTGRESSLRRVWSGPLVDILGAPTQDGKVLSFVDWTTGDLAVHDLSTGENRRLTNKGPWSQSPAFALFSVPSPNGKLVAYGWYDDRARADLRIVPIAGGDSRVVFGDTTADLIWPSEWTPDGKSLLCVIMHKDRQSEIVTIDAVSGAMRIVKRIGTRMPTKFAFSPDGRFIAYDVEDEKNAAKREVLTVGAAGGDENTIVSNNGYDAFVGWTPDGRSLVFRSDRTGSPALWSVAVRDGKAAGDPALIQRNAERTMSPMSILRDGSLIYGTQERPTDIYTATLDAQSGHVRGAPARVIEHFIGANSAGSVSRDGKWLVYSSKRLPGLGNAGLVLVVRSLETGNERVVPAPLTNFGPPSWSPDGRFIVVGGASVRGERGLWRVDPQSGELVSLAPGNGHQFAGWAEGGKSIVYRDVKGKNTGFVIKNLESGASRDVIRLQLGRGQTVPAGQVSPDGSQLVFRLSQPDSQMLEIVPVAGGQPRELIRFPRGESAKSFAWSADGRSILYSVAHDAIASDSTAEAPKLHLMRIVVDGGSPTDTGLAMEGLDAIQALPNGGVTFTSGSAQMEIWMMQNFLGTSGARSSKQ